MTFQKNSYPNLDFCPLVWIFLRFKKAKNMSFLFCSLIIKHLFLKIFVGLLYSDALQCYLDIKAPERYQDVRFQSHCTNLEMCLPLISPLGWCPCISATYLRAAETLLNSQTALFQRTTASTTIKVRARERISPFHPALLLINLSILPH